MNLTKRQFKGLMRNSYQYGLRDLSKVEFEYWLDKMYLDHRNK